MFAANAVAVRRRHIDMRHHIDRARGRLGRGHRDGEKQPVIDRRNQHRRDLVGRSMFPLCAGESRERIGGTERQFHLKDASGSAADRPETSHEAHEFPALRCRRKEKGHVGDVLVISDLREKIEPRVSV